MRYVMSGVLILISCFIVASCAGFTPEQMNEFQTVLKDMVLMGTMTQEQYEGIMAVIKPLQASTFADNAILIGSQILLIAGGILGYDFRQKRKAARTAAAGGGQS